MKRLHFIFLIGLISATMALNLSNAPIIMTSQTTPSPDSVEPANPADCAKPAAAGRPRAADVQARTENLVGIAFKLFLQHGYSNVSLEQIAREAKVAVRTIYVKFGGKMGLLQAAISTERARFLSYGVELEQDTRPLPAILTDFGLRYLALVASRPALNIQRIVIAEARSNPELVHTFYESGPAQTMAMLARFFARPEIQAQLRPEVPIEILPAHLLNCLVGDRFRRLLFDMAVEQASEEHARQVQQGVDLFLHGVGR